MRKIISAAVVAATLATALGTATVASAQEWGPPRPTPSVFGPGPHGWEQGPGGWGAPYHADYWQQRRYWEWRHYRELHHREYCRWHQCW